MVPGLWRSGAEANGGLMLVANGVMVQGVWLEGMEYVHERDPGDGVLSTWII